jgi:hypothetical protein
MHVLEIELERQLWSPSSLERCAQPSIAVSGFAFSDRTASARHAAPLHRGPDRADQR